MRISYLCLLLLLVGAVVYADVPSGIPEKAEQASQIALGWSPDRKLVRIEVEIHEDPGGKIWRNQNNYRFAFYSPSKQRAIWVTDTGDVDRNGFPVPPDWSTQCALVHYLDLPEAMKAAGQQAAQGLSGATLAYVNRRPKWIIRFQNGLVASLNTGSVERELQDSQFEGCISSYDRKEYEKAFACTKKLAEQGLDAAQFVLGLMYFRGEGVQKSRNDAEKWMKLAANQDYCPAGDVLQKLMILDAIDANKLLDEYQKKH
jgi:hypothetical protein